MIYNIDVNNLNQAKNALKQIDVSHEGIELMADKMLNCNIKIKNIKLAAANILKQEMLSIGAEAAVAKGVVNGKTEISDVIISGSLNQIKKLIGKLEKQSWFGLADIRLSLSELYTQIISNDKLLYQIGNKSFYADQTYLMGILNVTPDSFSDGNCFHNVDKAVQHCMELIGEGADIIDIGGESSRPGSDPVSLDEEIKRVIPVIEHIRKKSYIPISVDTYHSETARMSIQAGADIINDISALRLDKELAGVLADNSHIPLILMHMQGLPKTMQNNPEYDDVIDEIMQFFAERIAYCLSIGISKDRIILDPGIGFGKRLEDNLKILGQLTTFKSLGCPVLLGASRKSFFNQIYPSLPQERLMGTLATSALAFQSGLSFIRIHDVKANKEFLSVLKEVRDKQ